MRFVHVGDLHLGKVIHQNSLLEIQRELLFELLSYMDNEDIRLLVIAGDVYDRYIPSQEAVNLLDEFLSEATMTYHIEVLMISGNHDSADRLHFASSLLQKEGLFIETYLKEELAYVEKDNVRFYLMPFAKPSQIKHMYDLETMPTYQEAFEIYLSHQSLDKSYKNIMITHQFVGHSSITSDSEMPMSVGGSEVLSASLFDDFDYVALGHLHAPQAVTRETMRYSGSLMRYSFDETSQKKSITIVDTDDMSISFYELHPSMNLEKYKGTFDELMNPDFINKKDDFLAFELEDDMLIPHAIDKLRVLYPHLLQITYTYLMKQESQKVNQSIHQIEKVNMPDLFKEFYYEMKNQELNEKQMEVVENMLEKVGDESEDY